MTSLTRAVLVGAYSAGVALAPAWQWRALGVAPLVAAPVSWWLLIGPNHWIAAFLAAAMLLPPLPIPIGNSGPHPSLLFALAGIAMGVIRARAWRLRLDSLGVALLTFFTLLFASVASAAVVSGAAIAAGSLVRVLLFGISLYVYFYTVHGPGKESWGREIASLRWLFCGASLAAAFACIDFYYQFPAPAGYGAQFVWLASGVFRRAQGLFYEASTLGNFCAFFLVVIAVLASDRRGPPILPWTVTAASGAIFFGALMLSYSRASIAALAIAAAALLLLRWRQGKLGAGVIVIPISIAAGVASLYLLLPAFGEIYWKRITGSIEFLLSDTNGILSGRLESWRTVLSLIRDNPAYLLSGIGYKTLPYTDLAGRPLVADNMYLSLLIETGLFGLSAFLWMNVCLLRTAYAAATHPDGNAALLGTIFFCFWTGELAQMLSGDLLTYWRVLPLYFWVLAAAVRLRNRTNEHPLS